MYDFTQLKGKLFEGDVAAVEELTRKAVNDKAPVKEILDNGLIAGMDIVGKKFKANDIFVPEVLMSAKAMQSGMKVLEPLLAGAGIKPIAKIVIGTVKGDLHDIGKNLVSMMFKGAGIEVFDYGIDVQPERFVSAVKEKGVNVIALSSLLTTSMPSMKKTIDALKASGASSDVKVIIGGAPVTQEYADQIGADAYASDAASAVDKVKELLGIK